MEDRLSVSIVIPARNESDSLPELLRGIAAQIEVNDAIVECIIVDDGSTDSSVDRLQALQQQYAWLKVIEMPQHMGKSAALLAGLNAAAGQVIMTMDADLQDDPASILLFLDMMINQQLDMVVGWRKHREDSALKRISSLLYNKILNGIFAMHLHDHNCGAKLIKREALNVELLKGDWHRYITVLVRHSGFRIAEVVVAHHPRRHNHSRYGIERYFKFLYDLPTLYMTVLRLKSTLASNDE